MTLAAPFDAAAPPQDTWGPMLVVALVVVAVVAMILGFGRITRRGDTDDGTSAEAPTAEPGSSGRDDAADARGASSSPPTTSEDELPTDPV
ncbi:MAG: hypothetical protein ACKOVB_03895 [Terrabacter sp.]